MSKEIEEITSFVERIIPPEILTKLKATIKTPDDLRNVLLWQEDSPHKLAHILDAQNIYHYLAVVNNLSPVEEDLGNRTIRFHDLGYKFSEAGLIHSGEHHFASVYAASIIDPDMRVLESIFDHIKDRLSENAPLWSRLVRDADRISALGPTGANRLAHYFNFVDDEMDEALHEELINKKIYCNLLPPPALERILKTYNGGWRTAYEGYDLEAFNYFLNKVFPFLVQSGKLLDFGKYLDLLHSRFIGFEPIYLNNEYPESVHDSARELFDERARFTQVLSNTIIRTSNPEKIIKHVRNVFSQVFD